MVRIIMRDMICCILQLVWVYSQYSSAMLQKMERMKKFIFVMQSKDMELFAQPYSQLCPSPGNATVKLILKSN
jgi:hypothetical protein